MKFVIKTFEGLEDVLSKEIQDLGAQNIQIGKRMVSCEGTLADMYKLNMGLHTAVRILVPIIDFEIQSEQDFYDKLMKIDWEEYLNLDETFAIDSVVNSEIFNHSKFVAYRMKDAIADWFTNKYEKRPDVDRDEPTVRFNVYISKNTVNISLDSSGESLHKRGYRQEINEAPMNEVLAAGILRLAGYDGSQALYDPMCGSGTFLIEGACISMNRPPCLFRAHFGFMEWHSFDAELFMEIKKQMISEIRTPQASIEGADVSIPTIKKAENNIKKAKLEEIISISRKDFFRAPAPEEKGIIVMNPPYGERIELNDAIEFYVRIGDIFKRNYSGFKAFAITSNLEAFKYLGLKPSFKKQLFSGALDCRLHGYDLYEGTRRKGDAIAE